MKATMRKLPLAALAALLLVALVAAPALAERYGYWGVARKPDGTVISGASVSVYTDAALTTAATVYDAYTGGSSSATPPQTTSNAYGQFAFWVDTSDYSPEQLFYIKVTSGSYTYTLYQVSIVQAGYLFSGGNLTYSALPTGGGTWAGGGDLSYTGGNLSISGALSVGSTPATAGYLRLPTAGNVAARNAADTANITLVSKNGTTDEIYLGSDVGTASTHIRSGGVIGVTVANAGPTTLLNAGVKSLETASQGILVYRGAESIDFNADWGGLGNYAYINSSTGTIATDDNLKILSDTSKIYLGSGDNASLERVASGDFIVSGGDPLRLRGTNVYIEKFDGSETLAAFAGNGAATLFYDNSISLATAGAGRVDIGESDSQYGLLVLYSDGVGVGSQGGMVDLRVHPDYDATIGDYKIQASGYDFLIGPDTDTDAFKYDGGSKVWSFTSGILDIGKNDAGHGLLEVFGDATLSAQGGDFRLYTAADYDTTINYYKFAASADDLVIGPNTNTDALKYNGGADEWVFTSGLVAVEGTNEDPILRLSDYGYSGWDLAMPSHTNNFVLRKTSSGDIAIKAVTDGAVTLYHDNQAALDTAGQGLIKILDAAGAPATPSGGFYMYSISGEPWVKDGGGTATNFGPHAGLDLFADAIAAYPDAPLKSYNTMNAYYGKHWIYNQGLILYLMAERLIAEGIPENYLRVVSDIPREKWSTDQATIKAKIDAERKAARAAKVSKLVAQRKAAEAATLVAASQAAREVEIANRAAELQATHGDTVPVPVGEEGEPVLMTPRQAAEREIAPALTKQEALAQVDVDAIRVQAEAEIPAIKPYQVKQPPAWLAQRIAAMEASK